VLTLCALLGVVQSFFLFFFSGFIRGPESLVVALLALAVLVASPGISSAKNYAKRHVRMFFIIVISLSLVWVIGRVVRDMPYISKSYLFYLIPVALPIICLYIIVRSEVKEQFK
jgi:hypothetical protein